MAERLSRPRASVLSLGAGPRVNRNAPRRGRPEPESSAGVSLAWRRPLGILADPGWSPAASARTRCTTTTFAAVTLEGPVPATLARRSQLSEEKRSLSTHRPASSVTLISQTAPVQDTMLSSRKISSRICRPQLRAAWRLGSSACSGPDLTHPSVRKKKYLAITGVLRLSAGRQVLAGSGRQACRCDHFNAWAWYAPRTPH